MGYTDAVFGAIAEYKNTICLDSPTKMSQSFKSSPKDVSQEKSYSMFIQQVTVLLSFTCRGIPVGRLFTRRFHSKGKGLKQYHHVRVDQEMKLDCEVWTSFLASKDSLWRPFVDFKAETFYAEEIQFFSDATKNKSLGFGGRFENFWTFGQWEDGFIEQCDPSNEYLELYAVPGNIFLWDKYLANWCVIIFCDNESMVYALNKMSSGCPNLMTLNRAIALKGLQYNTGTLLCMCPAKKIC